MKITSGTINDLAKRYESARTSVKRIKEQTEATVHNVVRSAELNSTSFAMGVINGRFGSPELLGVPVDLGIGVALHGVGFLGIASDHMHAIGDGCTSSYFSSLGLGIGKKMAQEALGLKSPTMTQLPTAP